MILNPLGEKINFKCNYDSSLLFAMPRSQQRDKNEIKEIKFKGYDVWNAYELSWLNQKGKPEVRLARILYSADSQNIVESKSLKLYLCSFSMTKYKAQEEVARIIKKDLAAILKTSFIEVLLYPYDKKIKYFKIPKKLLIDNLDVKINSYKVTPALLKIKKGKVRVVERYCNLLKTNCPITGQPDWATIYIKYKSQYKIEDSSLLQYIVSYREYADYHESCCEKIFNDIYSILNPKSLIVKCFFTRRGGIDINPIRFYGKQPRLHFDLHYWRQ